MATNLGQNQSTHLYLTQRRFETDCRIATPILEALMTVTTQSLLEIRFRSGPVSNLAFTSVPT